MARDAESLKVRAWAEDGDRLEPERRVPPIDRARGWTYDFSALEGETLSREVMNQILREITGMLVELNRGGSIPEYNPERLYKRGDMCRARSTPSPTSRHTLAVCHTDMTRHMAFADAIFWREY